MQPEKKSRRLILVIAAIILLGPCGLCGITVYGVMGPPEPPPHVVVSTKDNLCLEFTGQRGTQENYIMLTHHCDVPLVEEEFGFYEKGTYLDAEGTIECAWIQIADKDNDGLQEVYAHQDPICKEFAHPLPPEPTDVIYKIGRDGKFAIIKSH